MDTAQTQARLLEKPRPPIRPLELWGGLECTIARIGNCFRDQFRETGHYERPEDLDEIGRLGIRTLRYPVLWESVSPDDPAEANFRWHDSRLGRLKKLGIEPIIGLLHHGSGPTYTDLLDPDFPQLFAQHATRVAKRYPHARYFTPVNEPLTTARFSALYGFWYPHRQDMRSFARALINECQATVAAMAAIRAIIPNAMLVQTEDMGKTFSSELLRYQADYENERRWLSFDLLFGRVAPGHPWHEVLLNNGIGKGELEDLADQSCPPDILGINHYLTSERFLEDLEARWPAGHPVGGNGYHRYADLEAIRMDLPEDELGLGARLREVWERYQTPIAVTEVHHGCSRDEQLRWLNEAWRTALRLRDAGVPVGAITMWSMFGAVDWNSLLQIGGGHYEAGAFDIRSGKPRPTALAAAAKALATEGKYEHPTLDTPGWWRRPERLYRPYRKPKEDRVPVRKILLVAQEEPTRLALEAVLRHRGLAYKSVRCGNPEDVCLATNELKFDQDRPWAIVHLASVRDGFAAAALMVAAASRDLPLVRFEEYLSSDGSSRQAPADARDLVGQELQEEVLKATHPSLLIQMSRPFSVLQRQNFLFEILEDVRRGKPVQLCPETPARAAYLPDVFHAGLDLLIDGVGGLCCLENRSDQSWFDFAGWVVTRAGLSKEFIEPIVAREVDRPTSLPAMNPMMPSLNDAVDRYLDALSHMPAPDHAPVR